MPVLAGQDRRVSIHAAVLFGQLAGDVRHHQVRDLLAGRGGMAVNSPLDS